MNVIKDICHICRLEKDGYYCGDYDNPIFICADCDKKEEYLPIEVLK